MLFFGLEDVIAVGTAEVKTSQNPIDEALKGFGGIPKNVNEPNGEVVAGFGMSSVATGIWWHARPRSIVGKIIRP